MVAFRCGNYLDVLDDLDVVIETSAIEKSGLFVLEDEYFSIANRQVKLGRCNVLGINEEIDRENIKKILDYIKCRPFIRVHIYHPLMGLNPHKVNHLLEILPDRVILWRKL